MESKMAMHTSPRCEARSKRSGQTCRCPAIQGKTKCRMHGGKGSGAPIGNQNAWKHGDASTAVLEERRMMRALFRELAEVDDQIDKLIKA